MNVGQVLEAHLGYAARHGWEGEAAAPERPQDRPGPQPRCGARAPCSTAPTGTRRSGAGPSPEGTIEDLFKRMHSDGADGQRLVASTEGRALRRSDRRPYDKPVTVSWIYILKLMHLVDDKIHASRRARTR